MTKIAIIVYSTWGHLYDFAREVQKGVEKAGGQADLFRVPETLTDDVLEKLHAATPPEEFKIATLETLSGYDAFLFGVPTRFGTLPAQWFDFWGTTGGLWSLGALYGKPAGVFVSTGTPGGGQEVTVRNYLSIFAHHGLIYVPLGYKAAFLQITNTTEVHGGSPWGAGVFAGAGGERSASELEKETARIQGEEFYTVVTEKFDFAAVEKPAKEPVKPVEKPASLNEKAESVRVNQTSREKPEKEATCWKCIIM